MCAFVFIFYRFSLVLLCLMLNMKMILFIPTPLQYANFESISETVQKYPVSL